MRKREWTKVGEREEKKDSGLDVAPLPNRSLTCLVNRTATGFLRDLHSNL